MTATITALPEPGSAEDVARGAAAFRALVESQVADGYRWVSSYRGVADFERGGSFTTRRHFKYDRTAGTYVPATGTALDDLI